ncbi:MAG: phospholipase D family protein [Polyangiaceae bacterium]
MLPKVVRKAERRLASVELCSGEDVYERVILGELPAARVSVWIATANLKDLRVPAPVGTRARAQGRYVSIVETLADLAAAGVEVRILHAGLPSGPFRASFAKARSPRLTLRQCPRVHLKLVIVDGWLLYLGSANFTGAGLGARGSKRRNFELGILSDDEHLLDRTQAEFDAIWRGASCAGCGLRSKCDRPIDTLGAPAPGSPSSRSPRARSRRAQLAVAAAGPRK